MKKSKFNEKDRLSILAKRDGGMSVEEICRIHQISPATFYKWKREFTDSQDESKRRVKELESENARLKKMYAELMNDHEILQEGLSTGQNYISVFWVKSVNRSRFSV